MFASISLQFIFFIYKSVEILRDTILFHKTVAVVIFSQNAWYAR